MRISEVPLRVGDVEADGAALAALLGTSLLADPAGLLVRVGWTAVRPVASSGDGVDHLAILIPGGSFAAAKAWLADRTPLLDRDGETDLTGPPGWDSTSVYFDGPHGVVLELIEHRGHRPWDGAAFPDALLGVCEVGIAAPAVPDAVATSGLPVFAGTAAPDFAAVGDLDGRLILAAPGRVWLPTADRVAGLAPLDVAADGLPAAVRIGEASLRPA